MHALSADRAEKQTGETSATACADHEKVRSFGALEQHVRGLALDGLALKLDARVLAAEHIPYRRVEPLVRSALDGFHQLVERKRRLEGSLEEKRLRDALTQREPPDVDRVQDRAARARLLEREPQRCLAFGRAVDADNDPSHGSYRSRTPCGAGGGGSPR